MHDTVFPLLKIGTIITSFYGQVAPKTQEVIDNDRRLLINQYFYFTQICLLMTTLILTASFIKSFKGHFLFSLILPNIIIYELIVITIYWSLFFTAPELILGPVNSKKENYDLIIDLCQHVSPLLGLLILFCENPLFHDFRRYVLNGLVAIIYTLMLKYNRAVKGQYPYDFMNKLGDLKLVFIFIPVVVTVFSAVLYGVVWLSEKIRELLYSDDYEIK